MLTNTSRLLTYLVSALYAALGFFLFLLPEQMAPVFAWKVTGFMTMTIGGWCLGNAWLAFFTARRWEWRLVYPALVYLWTFGILEALVVVLFRDRLQLVHPIAWLYLVTLVVNVIAAIVGVTDWLRLRPSVPEGERMSGFTRFMAAGFVVFVGFLGIWGLTAQVGDLATNGEIFPEVMSLFTLRSFGAFYLSLTVGMIPLLFERNRAPFLNYAFLALGLIVIITAAAFAYLHLFDFSLHPYGALYFGAYIAAGLLSLYLFWRYGTGYPGEEQTSGYSGSRPPV
jgi:hypothetical protein